MKDFQPPKEPAELNTDIQYDLSIQVSLDGFSLIIKPFDSKEISFFRHIPAQFTHFSLLSRNFRELTETDAIFNLKYRKVSIILSDQNFSLVPTSVYSEKLLNFLFPVKQKPAEPREIIVSPVEYPEALLAFSIPGNIADFIHEKFPGCILEHEVTHLISNILSYRESLFIHFHSSWFYALNSSEGKPLFLNTYRFREKTDILYYLTAIIQHLDFKGMPVFLSGLVSLNDEKYLFLRKALPLAEILNFFPGKEQSANAGVAPFQLLPGMISL